MRLFYHTFLICCFYLNPSNTVNGPPIKTAPQDDIPPTLSEARLHYNNNELDRAFEGYVAALLSPKIETMDRQLLFKALTEYSIICLKLGKYPEVPDMLDRFDWKNQKSSNDSIKSRLYSYLGLSYFNLDRYREAASNFMEGIDFSENSDENFNYYFLPNNLGLVNNEIGNYKRAITNYNHAIRIAGDHGYPEGIAAALSNIGQIYYDRKLNDSSYYYFQKSLDIQTRNGFERGRLITQVNMANLDFRKGDLKKALAAYKQSLVLNQKVNISYIEETLIRNIGTTYLELDILDSAEVYIRSSIKDQMEKKSSNVLMHGLGDMIALQEKKGAVDSAFYYYKQRAAIKDSIMGAENFKAIEEIQAKYDNEKSQRELLERENDLKQLTITVLIISIIALVSLILYIKAEFLKKALKGLVQKVENELNRTKHALEDEINVNKAVYSENEEKLAATKDRIERLCRQEKNKKEVKQLATELFYKFNYTYPGFSSDLSREYRDIKLTDLQMRACKLIALGWYENHVPFVYMGITSSQGSYRNLLYNLRQKFSVEDNLALNSILHRFLKRENGQKSKDR